MINKKVFLICLLISSPAFALNFAYTVKTQTVKSNSEYAGGRKCILNKEYPEFSMPENSSAAENLNATIKKEIGLSTCPQSNKDHNGGDIIEEFSYQIYHKADAPIIGLAFIENGSYGPEFGKHTYIIDTHNGKFIDHREILGGNLDRAKTFICNKLAAIYKDKAYKKCSADFRDELLNGKGDLFIDSRGLGVYFGPLDFIPAEDAAEQEIILPKKYIVTQPLRNSL